MSDQLTLKGGCHCGRIRYTATIPPSSLQKLARCNCTFCTKLGNHGISMPPSSFTLLSPASSSEMGDYYIEHPGTPNKGHRYFCAKCGVHVYMQATYEFPPGKLNEHFSVNVSTVDQPQPGVELSELKFKYVDGLNNNFGAELADRPFPGGLL